MMRSVSTPGLKALALCLPVLLLSACGGGGSSTTATTAGVSASQPASPPGTEADPVHRRASRSKTEVPQTEGDHAVRKQRGAEAGSRGARRSAPRTPADRRRPKHRPAPAVGSATEKVTVPPISSAPKAGSTKPAPGVKTVKGGDNSVQEYGVEAGESGRRAAAIALQAYLDDRAEGDWKAACAALGQKATQQVEEAARSLAAQGTEVNGCPATMSLLEEGAAELVEQAKISEVLSFRGGGEIAGNPSFLIFSGPPSNTLYSMPMYMEGGDWKVGLLRALQLPT